MKTPSVLRPHSITVVINMGEDENFNTITKEIRIEKVRVNTNYGLEQNNRGLKATAEALLFIDMNDYVASDVIALDTFKQGMVIMFGAISYVINTIKPISSLQGILQYIEIGMNAS